MSQRRRRKIAKKQRGVFGGYDTPNLDNEFNQLFSKTSFRSDQISTNLDTEFNKIGRGQTRNQTLLNLARKLERAAGARPGRRPQRNQLNQKSKRGQFCFRVVQDGVQTTVCAPTQRQARQLQITLRSEGADVGTIFRKL